MKKKASITEIDMTDVEGKSEEQLNADIKKINEWLDKRGSAAGKIEIGVFNDLLQILLIEKEARKTAKQ